VGLVCNLLPNTAFNASSRAFGMVFEPGLTLMGLAYRTRGWISGANDGGWKGWEGKEESRGFEGSRFPFPYNTAAITHFTYWKEKRTSP
jgi:hypothetical protein